MHKYPIIIREYHLDTFGHVNNATYLQLYEEARWEWITAGGYGFHKIQESQRGPVILDVSVTFIRELSLREQICIETETTSYDGKVGKIAQRMRFHDNSLASEAEFTMAFFDLRKRKIIKPTEEWLHAIDFLQGS